MKNENTNNDTDHNFVSCKYDAQLTFKYLFHGAGDHVCVPLPRFNLHLISCFLAAGTPFRLVEGVLVVVE